MSKLVLLGAGLAGFLALGYQLWWPLDIDPAVRHPPAPPLLAGPYARNDRLRAVRRLLQDVGVGPEDVAVDAFGRIYGGTSDGRIWRVWPDGSGIEAFIDTGGRPLGLDFDRAGNLIVADGKRGLLSVSPKGEVAVLATEAEGLPFAFTNDVDVG